MPKIDVLIPFYNPVTIQFEDCIQSLNRQSLKDFRAIFINDGSNNDFYKSLKYCHFEYLLIDNLENSGIAAALNLGLKHQTAPYIARMDSDDICHPDRFSFQYQIMVENSGLDVIFSNVTKFSNKRDAPLPKHLETSNFLDSKEIAGQLAFKNILPHPTAFMKSSVLHSYKYDARLRKSQDYDLWMRMLRDGLSMRYYPTSLLKYRVNDINKNNLQTFIFNMTRQKFSPEVVAYWYGDKTAELIYNLYNHKSLTPKDWVEFFISPIPKRPILKELIRNVIA
jgi:glycosyltransferase involved in cell wall biosynthesis